MSLGKLFREDLLDKSGEDGWVLNGHFREDFPIEGDRLGLQEGDELGIGRAVLPEGIVQADDPESADVTALRLAIAERIDAGLDEGFLGRARLTRDMGVKKSKLGMLYSVSKGRRSQILPPRSLQL